MTSKLFFEAITKMVLGISVTGLLVFLPAGTLCYFNGWILMGVLFVPMFFAGILLMINNPSLLKRRLCAKEKQKEQGMVVGVCAAMFVFGFVVAGLDFRFGWSNVCKGVVITAIAVFLLAYLLYAEVIRENKYLSRTVEVQENQSVIDKGLYGVVRHPMYFATLLLFLSIPLILGSVYSFFVFLVYPILVVKRIKFEEAFLEKSLAGYSDYKQKVKYRLVPFVW